VDGGLLDRRSAMMRVGDSTISILGSSVVEIPGGDVAARAWFIDWLDTFPFSIMSDSDPGNGRAVSGDDVSSPGGIVTVYEIEPLVLFVLLLSSAPGLVDDDLLLVLLTAGVSASSDAESFTEDAGDGGMMVTLGPEDAEDRVEV
jgi:hypothetical protein